MSDFFFVRMLDYISQFPGPKTRDEAIEAIKRELVRINHRTDLSADQIHDVIAYEVDAFGPEFGSQAAWLTIVAPRIRKNVEGKLRSPTSPNEIVLVAQPDPKSVALGKRE